MFMWYEHLVFSEICYGFQSAYAEAASDGRFSRGPVFGLPCCAEHTCTALLAESSQYPACPAPLLDAAESGELKRRTKFYRFSLLCS